MQQDPRDAVQEVPGVEVFNEALRDTRTWFRNALHLKLLKEYPENAMFSFAWELEVCHLLKIIIKRCFTVA